VLPVRCQIQVADFLAPNMPPRKASPAVSQAPMVETLEYDAEAVAWQGWGVPAQQLYSEPAEAGTHPAHSGIDNDVGDSEAKYVQNSCHPTASGAELNSSAPELEQVFHAAARLAQDVASEQRRALARTLSVEVRGAAAEAVLDEIIGVDKIPAPLVVERDKPCEEQASQPSVPEAWEIEASRIPSILANSCEETEPYTPTLEHCAGEGAAIPCLLQDGFMNSEQCDPPAYARSCNSTPQDRPQSEEHGAEQPGPSDESVVPSYLQTKRQYRMLRLVTRCDRLRWVAVFA